MSRFTGKKIAVIGLSIEGKDTLEFFFNEQCTLLCCDRRTKEELKEEISYFSGRTIDFRLGHSYLDEIDKVDIIVHTPGMSPNMPELIAAAAKGIDVTSSTKLFFELCNAPIIGVTGTKGKGTTSTLIAECIEKNKKSVFLGGNVGIPLLSKVHSIQKNDWVVLELSSFQLEDLTVSPHIAVVLRITQDHLANFDPNATNFHPTRQAYVEAKSNIVRYQHPSDVAVINSGDPTALGFVQLTKATIYRFDRYSTNADCYVENHAVYLREGAKIEKICSAADVVLRGDHNLENIAAATLAARAAGIPLDMIKQAVKEFVGLEHRLEYITENNGVKYYNDSFSTVPETTIAAVESFTEPKVLILGGSEKMSDFTQMGKVIAGSNTVGCVVIGQMTDRIVHSLQNAHFTGMIKTGCKTMKEIVNAARSMSLPGSVVILSPACASFDMFSNYKERGKLFKHEVLTLP